MQYFMTFLACMANHFKGLWGIYTS